MLIVLIGKTCSGKNTVVNLLKKEGFKPITTYTTRPKRRGEKDGREYHFISQDDFSDKEKDGFFAETKSYIVDGKKWHYGSPALDINTAIKCKDKYVVILTPQGVEDVKPLLNKESSLIIYLYSNRNTILSRLKKRKDNHDSKMRRMHSDEKDFKNALNVCDKIIYNNDGDKLEKVVEKIIKYTDKR